MTWANYIASGSGALAFRLDIGGLPTQFVGSDDMVAAAAFGTQARTQGLRMAGQKIRERADIVSAKLDVGGMRPKIVDVGNLATLYLGKVGYPTNTTWLAANATASATTITVSSTTGFAATNAYIWIDSECISYTGVTATSFTGCTRGVFNTLAQAHYIADGAALRYPAVTDQPITLEGQRARLYAYGDLDTLTGNGTLIYSGVVASDPRYDGTSWSIGVDPLTRLLNQKLGSAGSLSTTSRGIYYPANAPFSIRFRYYASATVGDTFTQRDITFPASASDTGFFESNVTFVDYFNDKIAAHADIPSWLTQPRAVADGESGWHIESTTDAATARYLRCEILQPGDLPGWTGVDLLTEPVVRSTGVEATTFATSTTYVQWSVAGYGACPRGYLIGTWSIEHFPDRAATFAAWPDGRIYTGGAVAPPTGTRSVAIKWPDAERATYIPAPYTITAGRVDIDMTTLRTAALGGYSNAAGFRSALELTYLVMHAQRAGVGDFIDALISGAPTDVNLGAGPDLRSGDVTSAPFRRYGDGSPDVLVARYFPGVPKHTVGDVVSAELQMGGQFLRLTSGGGITCSRLRAAIQSEASTSSIASILTKSLPRYERSSRGLVNTVAIPTRYDPAEDEWVGTRLMVRDVAAFGRCPGAREVEIKRLTQAYYGAAGEVTVEQAVDIASRIFGVLGGSYAEITVDVPLTYYDVVVGSVVRLTAPNVPSTDGTIGIADRAGIVIGREHDLTGGVLALSILVGDMSLAGYCPSAQIATETNVGGNIWDVTLADTEAPTGTTSSEWFAAGDAIRVWLFDSTTPAVQTGDVTSVTGSTVRITLDGAAALGTGDWVLEYDAATAWSTNPDPPFLFLASAAGRVSLPTALPAWGFSP